MSLLLCVSLASADVLINEFVVDPQTDWDGSGAATTNDEWFELYNPTLETINITGWILSLIDTNTVNETLEGVIPSGHFVVLNPGGYQNNDGMLILYNGSGDIIDQVTYGDYDDGNTADNAPDGNADNASNECLSRIHDGIDTDVDSDDFIKGPCTFNATNNRLPTGDIGDQEITEDVPDYFIITTITDEDGDDLEFTVVDENPDEVDCEVDGTNVTLSPALNWNGVTNCTLSVYDGYGTIDKLFNINVIAVNDEPEFDPALEDQTIDEDLTLTYDIDASDVDIGDILSFTSNITAVGGEINDTTGVLMWTPDNDDV